MPTSSSASVRCSDVDAMSVFGRLWVAGYERFSTKIDERGGRERRGGDPDARKGGPQAKRERPTHRVSSRTCSQRRSP